MLVDLSISNYALIRQLSFSPSKNLNGITGETGAGKSILLGALGLLLGKRADTKVLLNSEKKCIVEGTFNVEELNLKSLFNELDFDFENETIIRREIAPSGKSRAFVNDTPVNLDALKQLGDRLMDIHSQHDNLLLGGLDYQRFIIDSFAQNSIELENYQSVFNLFKEKKQQHKELLHKNSLGKEELDYKKKQLSDLEALNLNVEEFENLEEEMKLAENAQEIKIHLNTIIQAGLESEQSILSNLKDVQLELRNLSRFSETFSELENRLESSIIELKDILDEVETEDSRIDFDEEKATYLREKFDSFNSLLYKHQLNTVEELITLQEKLKEEVSLVENLDFEIEKSEKELTELESNTILKGKKLSDSRKKIVSNLSSELISLLSNLGMPNATIDIQFETTEPTTFGTDKIEILFSANKGIQPQSLKKSASGGEFSRLLFCIKYILASKTSLPTIVFDEIDTGVSGEISIRMGQMMQEMSKHHQIISITHLPQVAALANRHFFVFKEENNDSTHSGIKVLEGAKRVNEIAKMLSGDNPSEAAYQNAKELLSLSV